MDTLQAMIKWATNEGMLSDLGLHQRVPRVSIFADDVVLFFKPSLGDIEVIRAILNLFGDVSGLNINFSKSTVTFIRCSEELAKEVADDLQCQLKPFPITYLGLPLTVGRLRKADIWPLLDKFSNKFAGWKPKLLNPEGRLVLTRSVLMAMPIHFLTVLKLPSWALEIINKCCRGFVWKGEDEVNGGH